MARGHRRADAKGPGRVVAGGKNASACGATPNGKGDVFKGGVVTHLDRRVEAIGVDMDNFFGVFYRWQIHRLPCHAYLERYLNPLLSIGAESSFQSAPH